MNKVISLINWLEEKGCYINESVDVNASDESNRYLVALNDIPKDTLLYSFTDEVIIRKPLMEFVDFLDSELKNEDSLFKIYFETLPKDFNNHPVLKNESFDEIKELNTDLFNKLTQVKSRLNKDKLFASMLVLTRSWQHNGYGVMVPFADLCNHSSKNNAVIDLSSYCLKSVRDIKQGEQILISYGVKDEVDLYSCYGFYTINKEETRMYRLDLHKINSQYSDINKFIKSNMNHPFYITSDMIPDAVLQFFRIVSMKDKQFNRLKKVNPKFYENVISDENERRAWYSIARFVKENKDIPTDETEIKKIFEGMNNENELINAACCIKIGKIETVIALLRFIDEMKFDLDRGMELYSKGSRFN